jgi:hypothetical protein
VVRRCRRRRVHFPQGRGAAAQEQTRTTASGEEPAGIARCRNTRTPARTRARCKEHTHACTHARTQARSLAQYRARAHTHHKHITNAHTCTQTHTITHITHTHIHTHTITHKQHNTHTHTTHTNLPESTFFSLPTTSQPPQFSSHSSVHPPPSLLAITFITAYSHGELLAMWCVSIRSSPDDIAMTLRLGETPRQNTTAH